MIDNEIIDNLGRIFTLKEINGKSRLAFYRALGTKDSSNVAVLTELWSVMAVDTIDGKKETITQLVDIESIARKIDESNAGELIEKWLADKAEEKRQLQNSQKEEGVKDIKK